MSKIKVSNDFIYQELDKLANLYYSNCSINDILKYLSEVSNLSVILVTTSFEIVATYFSEEQFINMNPSQIIPLYVAPGKKRIIPFSINGKSINYTALSLPSESHYLCIDAKYENIDKYRKLIIKNSLPFLSLLLEKQKLKIYSFHAGQYAPFFRVLEEDLSASSDSIRQLCSLYHLDLDQKYVCASLLFNDKKSPADLKNIAKKIRSELDSQQYFLSYKEDQACILFFFPPSHQDLDAITQSYMTMISLHEKLQQQLPLRVGISCAHVGHKNIHSSYYESMQSIKVQTQLHLKECASSYFEQSIFHILNSPSMETFRKLALDTLSPLLASANTSDANYYEILKYYFHNNFNMQKTAKELHMHRNTLAYRIQHLKELLKFDFDFEHNIDALFTLYLCICVKELGYTYDGKATVIL